MARPLPSSLVVRQRFLSSFLDGLNRLDRRLVFLVVVGVELGVGRSLGTDRPSANEHVLDTLLLSGAMDSSSGCRLSVDDSTLDRRTESLNALTTLLPLPLPLTAWWDGDAAPPPPWTGGDGEDACEKVRDPAAAGDDRMWWWLYDVDDSPTGVVDEDAGVEQRESDRQLVDADSLCWMIFWQAADVNSALLKMSKKKLHTKIV